MNGLVYLVGPSGSGKTMSFANFPQDKIFYYDIERKGLPFKVTHPKSFATIRTFEDFRTHFRGLMAATVKPDFVVIDSLTQLCVYAETESAKQGGTDQWGSWRYLVVLIRNLFEDLLKSAPWITICTNIDEVVTATSASGEIEIKQRRASVPGRKWEGKLEEHATICGFTRVTPRKGEVKPKYEIVLENDGCNSAKCPPTLDMPPVINNDRLIEVVTKFKAL